MAILTFNNIMEAPDITEKTVPIPEWGGDVIVRSISYRQMEAIKKLAQDGDSSSLLEGSEVEQMLLVKGMVEPTVDEEQAKLLMEKSASAVMKVLGEIMGRSNAGENAVKEEEKSLPSEPE